ncbi:MAG: T9SS type A sorting domain-containing protein [Saprospiraceae bacterium]|nr:T9SS type A sorting domain-containing protein [Saprospiraceae bacterium]
MKKISTNLILAFLAITISVSAQAPRTVLFEHFTSATCPPCATTNPIFKKFLEPFGETVISMAFQCNIPQVGDPMYASNTTEVGTRMTYYGINSAPNARMDGKIPSPGTPNPTHPLSITAQTLNTRLAVTSPIEMHVDHLVILGTGGAKDSMDITITIKNVSASDFSNANYVLQTCIVEEDIKFPKQAATNSETEFHTVMRKMIPSAAGAKFTETIAVGATKTINYRAAVPAYIYSYKELGVVAYMQNNLASSKEVIQAAKSHPKEINGVYYDLAFVSSKLTGRIDQCDNTVGFDVEVKNISTGTDTIKTIDFIPVVAGSNKAKSTWTGVLLPGQTINHKVGNQTIAFGNTALNVFIDKINGGAIKDLNTINNFQSQMSLLTFNANVAGTEITQGFELPIAQTAPPKTLFLSEGLRLFKADSTFARNAAGALPGYGMGGFGKSRYTAFFAFSDGVPDLSASIIFDKVDLTNSKQTKMSWNYAYSTKTLDDYDKMEVLVSKDCGVTWTSVYENQGENMKSCEANLNGHIPGFFLPEPQDWKAESFDLSAYDGTPELIIRMKGTSGLGWAYFLDDVNVVSAVSTNNPGILKFMSVSPNPATDVLNIKLNVEEAAKSNISLTDLNGKVVRSMTRELTAGQNNIPMNVDQVPGVYILEVKTEKGVRTEKVSIL